MSFMSFWRNYVWKTSEPWAIAYYGDNGTLVVREYNEAFVNAQRSKLGSLCDGKTSAEVVALFVDRENVEREEPKLEVLHMGIEEDGRIKMKLDWNRAFIKHLADHGITGETEDEAIQNYLKMMTANELEGDVEPEEFFTKEQIETAFEQMDRELAEELEAARAQAQVGSKRKSRKKR